MHSVRATRPVAAIAILLAACTLSPTTTDQPTPFETGGASASPTTAESASAEASVAESASPAASASGPADTVQAQLDDTEFNAAVLMTGFDQADYPSGPPSQSESETTFGPSERIWLIYQLDPGSAGTITVTWFYEGEQALEPADLEYAADTAYAWAYIDPTSTGFEAGRFEALLELDNGDEVIVPFEVQR